MSVCVSQEKTQTTRKGLHILKKITKHIPKNSQLSIMIILINTLGHFQNIHLISLSASLRYRPTHRKNPPHSYNHSKDPTYRHALLPSRLHRRSHILLMKFCSNESQNKRLARCCWCSCPTQKKGPDSGPKSPAKCPRSKDLPKGTPTKQHFGSVRRAIFYGQYMPTWWYTFLIPGDVVRVYLSHPKEERNVATLCGFTKLQQPAEYTFKLI